jgi:hypothetical protein
MQLDDAVRKPRPSERPFRCSFGWVRNGVKCRFYAVPKHGERGHGPPLTPRSPTAPPSGALDQRSLLNNERSLKKNVP